MGSAGKALRVLFGVTVFVWVIWFLFVGIIANHVSTTKTMKMVSLTRNFKHWNFVNEHRHPLHQDLNLNYVSRRKIPNGPDPVHRRASKSRQPPGRI